MTSTQQPASASPAPSRPDTEQPSIGGVMPHGERSAFEADLAKMRVSNNSGPLDRRVGMIGLVGGVVGLVVILVCYANATSESDIRDQMEMLILALFGLGLIILGSVLYARNSLTRFMRYWLLRSIYEQRSHDGSRTNGE